MHNLAEVNLNRHGAMMFRGVPGLETVEDFTIFSRSPQCRAKATSSKANRLVLFNQQVTVTGI